MLKVIEVLSESDKGWEDAAAQAVAQTGRGVRTVESIYIKHQASRSVGRGRQAGEIPHQCQDQLCARIRSAVPGAR